MNLKLITTLGLLVWSAALGTLLWFLFLGIVALISIFRPL